MKRIEKVKRYKYFKPKDKFVKVYCPYCGDSMVIEDESDQYECWNCHKIFKYEITGNNK